MNVDNVKSQMRKGMLEYCIILLLHKEPAYASDIIQKLKEARLIVVEGTLYPLLTRLKNDDLLSYEWIESTQGPPDIPLATDGHWSEVVFTGSLDTRTSYFSGKSLCFGMAISALWHPFNLRACLNFPLKIFYQLLLSLFLVYFPIFIRQIARYPPY